MHSGGGVWGVSGGYAGGCGRSGRRESGHNHGGHGSECTGRQGGPLSSCNAPSQGHHSILLEEDLVHYFSGSSNRSGESDVELVGIKKGTSGTASAGGILDGFSYFGNKPNPNPEDDSPLSQQFEWITQFAKQRTTGLSKERKINTFTDALEVDRDVLLGQFPPQHLVTLFNAFMLDRRNKKRWKLENIALTVFDLLKHVNDWVKARQPHRINSAVFAFHVMYQHFDNIVTQKIQEHHVHLR